MRLGFNEERNSTSSKSISSLGNILLAVKCVGDPADSDASALDSAMQKSVYKYAFICKAIGVSSWF